MSLRYRIITGYKSSDYIPIPEEYLEKAISSMITGKVFVFKNHLVRGNEIKEIKPDYNYYTHWNDDYNPTSEADRLQIKQECPDELDKRFELANKRVEFILNNKRFDLLENPEKADNLLLN